VDKAETMVETQKHQFQVYRILLGVIEEFHKRILSRDQSKLLPSEADIFTEFTPKLKNSTYGSDEYNGFLKEMKVGLDNHYAESRHHPEHYKDGIDGMNLVDVLEMLCDWKAATMRHDDGNIYRSLEINRERFGISDQLLTILQNTVDDLWGPDLKFYKGRAVRPVDYSNLGLGHSNLQKKPCPLCKSEDVKVEFFETAHGSHPRKSIIYTCNTCDGTKAFNVPPLEREFFQNYFVMS